MALAALPALEPQSPAGRWTPDTPSRPRFYHPELDALRAFAFLFVFLHHALHRLALKSLLSTSSPLVVRLSDAITDFGQALGFGVSLFFFLSAYLIVSLLILERKQTGGISLKDFYVRRVLRIWPLYYFFILFSVVLGWIWPAAAMERYQAVTFVAMLGNWFIIRHPANQAPALILWSISIEEQFYLVWPWLAKLGGRTLLAIASAATGIVGVVVLWHLANAGADPNGAVWWNSFVQFMFFGAGTLLALSRYVPAFRGSGRIAMFVVGLFLLYLSVAVFHAKGDQPITNGWFLIGGYAAALAAVSIFFLSFLGAPGSWFPQWLRYAGKISYGLYVYHTFSLALMTHVLQALAHSLHLHRLLLVVLKLADAPLALVLTVVLAHFSYKYLETPFLRWKERFALVRSRPV